MGTRDPGTQGSPFGKLQKGWELGSGETLLGRRGGGLPGRLLPLGWPEDDRGGGATPCKVQPELSNWRDAWPSLMPDRQERGRVESTAVRELDREGLEQAGLTLRVLEGRTAGNCRIEQTAPREDKARLQKN